MDCAWSSSPPSAASSRASSSPTWAPTWCSSSPIAGSAMRSYEPFVDDVPEPREEPVLLALQHQQAWHRARPDDQEAGAERLPPGWSREADIGHRERATQGSLPVRGLDYRGSLAGQPTRSLIWISLTGFGRNDPRSLEPVIDLTILAGSGPAWNNGYDDHSLPPVRGGGNQGYHTGCHYGFMTGLVALLHRDATGRGQLIDVSFSRLAPTSPPRQAATSGWLPRRRCNARPVATPATFR